MIQLILRCLILFTHPHTVGFIFQDESWGILQSYKSRFEKLRIRTVYSRNSCEICRQEANDGSEREACGRGKEEGEGLGTGSGKSGKRKRATNRKEVGEREDMERRKKIREDKRRGRGSQRSGEAASSYPHCSKLEDTVKKNGEMGEVIHENEGEKVRVEEKKKKLFGFTEKCVCKKDDDAEDMYDEKEKEKDRFNDTAIKIESSSGREAEKGGGVIVENQPGGKRTEKWVGEEGCERKKNKIEEETRDEEGNRDVQGVDGRGCRRRSADEIYNQRYGLTGSHYEVKIKR